MKKYEIVLNGKPAVVGVNGGDVFDLSGIFPVKIKINYRLMTWLYDHDAILI